MFKIKVVCNNGMFHLVNSDEPTRMCWDNFISLVSYLRNRFPNNYNTELYKSQPVYEYTAVRSDIETAIMMYDSDITIL